MTDSVYNVVSVNTQCVILDTKEANGLQQQNWE